MALRDRQAAVPNAIALSFVTTMGDIIRINRVINARTTNFQTITKTIHCLLHNN
ncbi:hypothetical protein HC931_27685 [Candidatus Gracilibacteria bacterium]|nr:hypothetical protein [Candidatus Gracilibacteria bacterium]